MGNFLDRLIDLAQKTGDRLIVHDPMFGRDVVIMDVDSYEKMALNQKGVKDNNYDNPWSNYDTECDNCDPGLNFEEENDWDEDTWHSAGSILEERQKEIDNMEPWDFAAPDMDSSMLDNNESTPIEPKKDPEPNEWKEEPLAGDEPVFYEEPV